MDKRLLPGPLRAGALVVLAACSGAWIAGCSRAHYRLRADRSAYEVLDEKSHAVPEASVGSFGIMPDPSSRLFDPSPVDFPHLPPPAPQLYAYQIPPLLSAPASVPAASPETLPAPGEIKPMAAFTSGFPSNIMLASAQEALPPPGGAARDIDISPITIPASAWESIPPACRTRVLEFASARQEYVRTFGRLPRASEVDSSQRLSLEQIVELALLNSRAYQTQKERLYRTALRLTFERFQFDLKFSAIPGANRAELDYRHTRTTGVGTVNALSLPSQVQVDKALYTGGDFLARLANDIVLTFNGPQGFAADLSSELFAQVTQTVFQRDIRFESLTQAERNVLYVARDFARFRKELFNDLAVQYYNLLRTYRQVEIDSLNYFTLVRALSQRGEEFRVGLTARVQVDQIEQNVLTGAIALIGTCTRLERDLDVLKLTIGLPTETRFNLDLTELKGLTMADEAAVARQLVQRVRTRLQGAARRADRDERELLNLAIELLVRMQRALEQGGGLGPAGLDAVSLATLAARLQVDEAQLVVREQRKLLAADAMDPTASPTRLVQRHFELIGALIRLLEQQEQLGRKVQLPEPMVSEIGMARGRLAQQLSELEASFEELIEQLRVPQVADLLRRAEQLRMAAEQAASDAGRAVGASEGGIDEREFQRIVQQVELALQQGDQLLAQQVGGLIPVEISFDEAMLTALMLRLNLMNQRGFLADEWRQVKLAADNLKAILNLTASERIEDFRIRDSETRLNVRFEPPLNRFAQRNAFRESLIDYQAARRALMQLEDQIKFEVRNDLRDLSLSRQQYDLGVASAALAFERVTGTRQQLLLGVGGVQARDFLEAQTAYATALSTVAARHIGYLISRTQLFLDLELLQVDEAGFWPELRNPRFQPMPAFEPPPCVEFLPYGPLAPRVHYSREMRQMLQVPFGESMIFSEAAVSGEPR
jgi:outer membrane protein TolC